MKRYPLLIPLVALSGWTLASGAAPAADGSRQPNVVFIMTDDQGAADMGVYGTQDLETPHMDGLARRGVRFTQFLHEDWLAETKREGAGP